MKPTAAPSLAPAPTPDPAVAAQRAFPLAAVAGALAVGVGGAALVGWAFDLAVLKSIRPDWVSMKPNTAVAFVLTGLALLLAIRKTSGVGGQQSEVMGFLSRLCGMLAGLIGLLSLAEYTFTWNPGFDQWLFPEPAGTVGTSHPGRMAPDTALCFMLLAAGREFALRARQSATAVVATVVLGALVMTIALIEIFSYFTPALRTYGWDGLTMMALPAATMFAALGAVLAGSALQQDPSVPGGSAQPFARSGDATTMKLVLIFVGLAVGIIATGTFYYRSVERRFQLGVENSLSSIADLKVNELSHWRSERLADGAVLFRNSAFSALVRRFLAQPADAEARRQLLDWLGKYRGALGYDQVRLMDAQGVTRLSVPGEVPPACPLTLAAAAAGLRSGQVSFEDLHRHESDGRAYLQVTVPVRDEMDADRPLGTVSLRIDAADYLFPFIKKWPVAARTAETLLVRRAGNEVLYLNDLRFRPNAALRMQAQLDQGDLPAARAVLGQTGIMEGLDYRGVPVVAALSGIPDSPWFLVAKLDQTEAYELLRGQLWQISLTVGVFLCVAASGVGLIWWQARLRFYREQVAAAKVVRETAQLLAETQAMARLGGYVLDVASGRWSGTEALDAVFGIDQTYEHSVAGWQALIHPEDRAMMTDYLSREVIGARQTSNKEYRIIRHADKAERWVQGLGTLQFDATGQPVRMRGSIQDITERKLAEVALQESEAKFKGIFERSNIAMSLTQVSGELQVNQAFCDLLGYTAEELRGRSWQSITPAEDVAPTLRAVEGLLSGKQDSTRLTKRYLHKNGSVISGDVSTTLRRDGAGRPRYFITAVVDITAAKQAEAKIAAQLAELRQWHEVTIGRESRVLEVKQEVNELLARLGEPPRYASAEAAEEPGLPEPAQPRPESPQS